MKVRIFNGGFERLCKESKIIKSYKYFQIYIAGYSAYKELYFDCLINGNIITVSCCGCKEIQEAILFLAESLKKYEF